jgi:hypothetical protein
LCLEAQHERLEGAQYLLLDLLDGRAEGRILEVALPDDALDSRAHRAGVEDGADEATHVLARITLVPDLGIESPDHVVGDLP